MKKNTPKLRFPEFTDSWEMKKLGEVSDKVISTSNDAYIPIMTISAAHGFLNQQDRFNRVIAGNSLKKYILLNNGDFAYNRGNSKLAKYGCIFQQKQTNALVPYVYHCFRLIKQYNNFYEQYFKTKLLNNLKAFISSTARMDGLLNISYSDFMSLDLQLPSLPEQKKIGDFLSSVDKSIDILKRKKELLDKYKKGVMQKIFSREIRFKDDDGNDYPDWTEKKLGDIGHTYPGLIGKSGSDFGYGEPYITYKQIYGSPAINENHYGYVNIVSGENQNTVTHGDVLFTASSETAEEVGFSSVYLGNRSVYLNSFSFGFSIDSGILLSIYSKYTFRSPHMRSEIVKLAQGSTRYNISRAKLLHIHISVPCLSEQKKIGDFLSAIDKKIDIVIKQLESTELYKKSLLQQMFI